MERYDLMGTPTASSEEAGVLRVASEVDEKNCGCVDAAITPSNLYNLLNCRKANTAYVGNEIVACPYHTEFLLKCVQAGSTATGSLDTTNVTKGQIIDDGGVKWEVIVLPVELGGTSATTAYEARKNLGFGKELVEAEQLNNLALNTVVGVYGGSITDSYGRTLDFNISDGTVFTFGIDNPNAYEACQLISKDNRLYTRTKDGGYSSYSAIKRVMNNMQSGTTEAIRVDRSSYVDLHVTFAYPFEDLPNVVFSMASGTTDYEAYPDISALIVNGSITKTGFTIRTLCKSGDGTWYAPFYHWLAWEDKGQ